MNSFVKKATVKETSFFAQSEMLTVNEMYRIRGGYAEEKVRTKEIDVYDTREL